MKIRKPEWFKVPLSDQKAMEVHRLMAELDLHTVCRQAHCPNIGECFHNGTATFLILGDICTRNCRFCDIKSGKPEPPDPQEPERIAEAVRQMKLRHCVITGVNRDDLQWGGAHQYADTIEKVKKLNPETSVEALTGDFSGSTEALQFVLSADPDVFNHNIETVERLTPKVRDSRADYLTSLQVLRVAATERPDIKTKSGLLLGLGETHDEVLGALTDLRMAGCQGITIGQYIPPSARHYPVGKYYSPEEFKEFEQAAVDMGFSAIASGPLVRSSYHAATFFHQV